MRSVDFAQVMSVGFKLHLELIDTSVAQPNCLLPQMVHGDLGIGGADEQCPLTHSLELCIALWVGAVRHLGVRGHRDAAA